MCKSWSLLVIQVFQMTASLKSLLIASNAERGLLKLLTATVLQCLCNGYMTVAWPARCLLALWGCWGWLTLQNLSSLLPSGGDGSWRWRLWGTLSMCCSNEDQMRTSFSQDSRKLLSICEDVYPSYRCLLPPWTKQWWQAQLKLGAGCHQLSAHIPERKPPTGLVQVTHRAGQHLGSEYSKIRSNIEEKSFTQTCSE